MKNKGYLEWKHWHSSNFGEVTPTASHYYYAEIKRCKKYNSLCPLGSSLLELGFGNGAFLSFARQHGYSIEGTEINPTLLQLAGKAGFKVFDASHIKSLPSESKDLVVAFDVLEHLSTDSLDEFFHQLANILKEGGLLLARFPNADSPFGLEGQNGDPSHLNAIGIGKVKYYCYKHKFKFEFCGAEAAPLLAGSVPLTIRRLFTKPIHKILDLFVSIFFLPGSGVSFSSRNTVVILRK